MADQKKFLDYEGVRHLWSKINMQDYPNNKTLMAVINAIDETKADKTDIVQSDWNQNDPEAADYVKNRPFYTGDPVETVLVEESTVPFEDGGGVYIAIWPESFEAVEGQTYTVKFDGTEYSCVCQIYEGSSIVIGNLSIAGAGDDSGEPFIIINQGSWMTRTSDTSASHVISISKSVQEVKKIDSKYIDFPAYDNLLHANMEYVTLESDVTVNLSWVYPGWNGDPAQELSCALTEGMKYMVTWDGVEYKDLICVRDESVSFAFPYYLGDPILYGASNSITDSYAGATPFFISNNGESDNRWSIWAARSGNHTFSISVLQPDKISVGDIDCTTFIQSDFEENDRNAVSYIKNRTHYDSRREITYTFDGSLEGKEHIDTGDGWYTVKVSDDVPEDILTIATVTRVCTQGGEEQTLVQTRDSLEFYPNDDPVIAADYTSFVLQDFTGDGLTVTKGVWVFYHPDHMVIHALTINVGRLQQIPAKYIPLPAIEELLNDTLVAAGKTEFSTNAPAVISPAQDTPRLKAGKCYDVYVDGILQYTARCEHGKLWEQESADEFLVLVDPRGSGKQKIAESISNNQLLAVTDSGLPWSEQGLALEIYEVEQIPEKHLKNAVTSVNGKKGNVTLSADDVGALPADTEIPKVPDALPNPSKLILTGAVEAEYDGSQEVTVEIPSGGAGSDPVQSDWLQNDPSALDYVKNRTHYDYIENVTFDVANSVLIEATLPEGETIDVLVNGEQQTFPINVFEGDGHTLYYFGTITLDGLLRGETGWIIGNDEYGVSAHSNGVSDVVVCSVCKTHKIPSKYLPHEKVAFQPESDTLTEQAIQTLSLNIPVVEVNKWGNTVKCNQYGGLFVPGDFVSLGDLGIVCLDFSSLEEETVTLNEPTMRGGLYGLQVCDTATGHQIVLGFDSSPGVPEVDGKIYPHTDLQSFAYLHGHLFSFTITGFYNAGRIDNMDLTIKKIL